MNETVILAAIRASWIGQTVRDIPWMFGFLEFTHFVGLCVLFGSLLLVDLRLIGVLRGGHPKAWGSYLVWWPRLRLTRNSVCLMWAGMCSALSNHTFC